MHDPTTLHPPDRDVSTTHSGILQLTYAAVTVSCQLEALVAAAWVVAGKVGADVNTVAIVVFAFVVICKQTHQTRLAWRTWAERLKVFTQVYLKTFQVTTLQQRGWTETAESSNTLPTQRHVRAYVRKIAGVRTYLHRRHRCRRSPGCSDTCTSASCRSSARWRHSRCSPAPYNGLLQANECQANVTSN